MARETKVGLLAGLAFIICFAIILANRGRPIPVTGYEPFRIDSSARGRGDATSASPRSGTAGTAAMRASASSPHPELVTSTNRRSEQLRSASPLERRIPGSGADLVLLAAQDDFREPSGSGEAPGSAATPASTLPQQEQAARQRQLEARLDALTVKLDALRERPETEAKLGSSRTPTVREGRPGRTPTQPQRTKRNKPKAASSHPAHPTTATPHLRRHTVVSGDTLSKIAKAHYGTDSRTAVNAIFDANRGVLSSPDVLRVGMELALPVQSEATNAAVVTAGAPARRDRPSPKTTTPGAAVSSVPVPFRWYQVRKGDGYARIAREQLGSARRWTELFELNKDRFPDADRIREGVRIKMPIGGPSRTREGRS